MKKKVFGILTLMLLLVTLVSCFDNNHPCGGVITDELYLNGNVAIHTDLEGVYMTLNNVSTSAVSVTWQNETDKEILFGEGYSVEMLSSNGEWVSTLKGEIAFDAIALVLPSNGKLDKGYSLSPFDLSRVGNYRLRSEFYVDGEKYSTWVEFSVTMEIAEQVNRIPDSDLSEFAKFLDREGFVKGMSQGQLLDLAQKYSEGLDPSIVPVFCHYDGEFGGGCMANGELFGYENDYYAKDGKVRYSNSFYAAVEIESLVLPYGIKYGDVIGDVLEKLAIDRDIYKNTAAFEGTKLELYNDGTTSLTLVNKFLTDAPVDYVYDIELIYTDKTDTFTRTVTLSFSDSKKDLARIEIITVDEYEK
ncbi:MAG: hypothetical protein IIX44_02550 [Clostridia bacterium]|nr:hypothetical protein [Clostridia bacterium]